MLGGVDLGIADHGQRAGHEQAAQIAVALFADTAEPVLASARVLLRHEPNPGREVAPRSEHPWVRDTRDQSGRQQRTDPRNIMKALARLIGPIHVHDHAIELHNLLLNAEQLIAEWCKARAG